MKITVCIGSSCHLKGSRQIVEKLQKLVSEHALKDEIELAGTFCMGQCQKGVCVDLDGRSTRFLRKLWKNFSMKKYGQGCKL